MENKKEKVGIRIKNSPDAQIENNLFENLDVAVDAENAENLRMKGNVARKGVSTASEPKWYKNPKILVSSIVALTVGLIGAIATLLR